MANPNQPGTSVEPVPDVLQDFMKVGKTGKTYHRVETGGRVSNHQAEQLIAHADQVQDGLASRYEQNLHYRGFRLLDKDIATRMRAELKAYQSGDKEIPEEWQQDLEGLSDDEKTELLAERIIRSDAYMPDMDDDESKDYKQVYNGHRFQAHDLLLASDDEFKAYLEQGPYLNELQEDDLGAEIERLVGDYTTQATERSKRMFEGKRTRAEIDATREELSDMMSALATHMADILEQQGATPEDIAESIDQFMAEATSDIILKIEQQRAADFENSHPMMKKFYQKWADWGEQGWKGSIKKSLVFAVPGVAAGAAVLAGAGAVGIGAGAALAVTGARSIGRTLVGARIDKKANSRTIAEAQTEAIHDDIARAEVRAELDHLTATNEAEYAQANVVHSDVLELIDERMDVYRKQNQRRMMGSMAIALTAGMLSYKGGEAVSWLARKAQSAVSGGNGLSHEPHVGRVRSGAHHPHGGGGEHGHGGGHGSHASDRELPTTGRGMPTGEHMGRNELFDGHLGATHMSDGGREAMMGAIDGYKVQSGDTVWDLSEKFLQEQGIKNPSIYEIDATKDILLQELKNSGQVDTHGWLSVGQTLAFSSK